MQEVSDRPYAVTPSLWVGSSAPEGVKGVVIIVPGYTDESALYAASVIRVVSSIRASSYSSEYEDSAKFYITAPGPSPVVVVASLLQAGRVLRHFGLSEDEIQDRIRQTDRLEGFNGGQG